MNARALVAGSVLWLNYAGITSQVPASTKLQRIVLYSTKKQQNFRLNCCFESSAAVLFIKACLFSRNRTRHTSKVEKYIRQCLRSISCLKSWHRHVSSSPLPTSRLLPIAKMMS